MIGRLINPALKNFAQLTRSYIGYLLAEIAELEGDARQSI